MIMWLVAFVCMSVGMVYFKQEGMLYHPAAPEPKYRYVENMPPGMQNPLQVGLDYKDVYIKTKDGVTLHAWLCYVNKNAPKNFRTTLFFHGNAGNIGARLPNIEVLCKALNTNVLIIDYRGYGHSTGEPSEEGLHQDALATLEHALNDDDIDPSRLYIFGRSLGGAVAARLAMNSNQFKGVIIENTFTSIGDMVNQLMPLVAKFKDFI